MVPYTDLAPKGLAHQEDHFGESGTGESAEGQEDRSERQPVAGEFAAAWIGAREFHSAEGHP